MKIGIITIVDPTPNYGNKLQNYAVEQLFSGNGREVVTLAPCRQSGYGKLLAKYAARRLLGLLRIHRFSPEQRALYARMFSFHRFDRNHLHIREDLCRGRCAPEDYNYFVTGSDQVWNPEQFWDGRENAYLLTFARPEQKVCISPSFGVEHIESDWVDFFRQALSSFPALAVREPSGAQIVYDLLGVRPPVMIDPTLMLTADAWRKISRPSKKRKNAGPYMLTCFLSGNPTTHRQYAQSLAQAAGLPCWHLLDEKDPALSGAGPEEFLDLVEHAQAVITDSFHAVAFSIIFRRPFVVADRIIDGRPVMGERIQALLETLGISGRQANQVAPDTLFHCDFSQVDDRLAAEQAKIRRHIAASCPAKQPETEGIL